MGSDTIACGRVSSFLNDTRLQALIRTSAGERPAGPITMDASVDGADGLEPHESAASARHPMIAPRRAPLNSKAATTGPVSV
jgi:hypothetical protein